MDIPNGWLMGYAKYSQMVGYTQIENFLPKLLWDDVRNMIPKWLLFLDGLLWGDYRIYHMIR